MKILALVIPVLLLVGCNDEISLVKEGKIGNEKSYKNGDVLDNRKLCEETKWVAYEKNDVKHVKYTCRLKAGKEEGAAVYSATDMKAVEEDTRKLFLADLDHKHEYVLKTINGFMGIYNDLVGRFDTLPPEDLNLLFGEDYINFYEVYHESPEGKDIIERLQKAGYVNQIGLSRLLPDHLLMAHAAGNPEIDKVIKDALDGVGKYISLNTAKLIKDEKADYKARKDADYEVKVAVQQYEKTHPVSRTETIIWSWNKLDKQYDRRETYTDYEWANGKHEIRKLCLNYIVFSITENTESPDDYSRLNGHCAN